MSRLTGTLGHALLGVLAEGPRTGYGLVRHLAQSIAYAWPASHSQVYPELAKLREAGLIHEGASAPRGGRVYELTDAGLAEVRRWLRETEPSRTVRDESALRLFLLWLLEPEEAEAYLRGEAEQRARAARAARADRRAGGSGHPEDARVPHRARARPAHRPRQTGVGGGGAHSNRPPVSVTTYSSVPITTRRRIARMELIHTCYRITDIDRSVAFYEALGFEERARMPIREEAINVFMGLPGDGDRLELTYNFGVDAYELGTGYGHIAITVDDMDATLAALAEQGIEPERPKYQVREGGSFIAFVRDPDGYRVELIERGRS